MFKIILYLLGVIFISLGIFFTILYLNIFVMGYSFWEFVQFISKEPIIWLIIVGIICILISLDKWIFKLKKKSN